MKKSAIGLDDSTSDEFVFIYMMHKADFESSTVRIIASGFTKTGTFQLMQQRISICLPNFVQKCILICSAKKMYKR